MSTRAVFFDVDFTLIYPGPRFRGEGYQQFCEKHGMTVDPRRFEAAVASASSVLDEMQEAVYDPAIFLNYTKRIIENMGGAGEGLDACVWEIYEEWAACHHFSLYEEVPEVFQRLAAEGVKIGLISNTHRSLATFETHFALDGLIAGAVSSSEHGFMKPHPSIFEAALRLLEVAPEQAMMVGDSFRHDIEGALRVGMRGVLVRRSDPAGLPPHPVDDVPIIRSLTELPALL